MSEENFNIFLGELNTMRDNKAIAYYLQKEPELSTDQKIFILRTFLIQCIQKIAGLEHIVGKKV